MGLFDSIAGQILGGSQQGGLLQAVLGILTDEKRGGLSGILQQLQNGGLDEIVKSWVSVGKNLPVDPQQLQRALGPEVIHRLATQTGAAPDQIAHQLSELLPKVIDKLTPDGKVPQGDLAGKAGELLKGILG